MVTRDELERRCRGAILAGVEFDDLLQRSLIPTDRSGLLEITGTHSLLLSLNLIERLDDEMHGFSRARRKPGESAMMLACLADRKTLGAALDRMVRYLAFRQSALSAKVTTSRRWIDFKIAAQVRRDEDSSVLEESHAQFIFQAISWFTGQAAPLVHLQTHRADHPLLGRRHPLLGVPLVLGRTTALRFPISAYNLPRRTVIADNPVLEAVDLWMSGAPVAWPLARRDSRNAEILSSAIARLQSSQDSLDTIAESLGYAEPRSLRRLIKNKTGKSPSEWRALSGETRESMGALLHARTRAREMLARLIF